MRRQAIVGWMPVSDDPRVASGRLRCRAPMALLRRKGFPVEIYRPENEGRYHAVVFQKRFGPDEQVLSRRLRAKGARVVLDLCDNYLYVPGGQTRLAERADDVRRMLDLVDEVTVPTETLAWHLPRPSTVVRDGVEGCGLRTRLPWPRADRRLDLVWFGTWGFPHVPGGMRDIALAGGALTELAARTPVRLTVVSNSRETYERWVSPLPFPSRYVAWRGHGQLCGLLRQHDACLVPVRPNPYTECKSPNRLTLALSLGLPAIATGIPSYREFRAFCTLDDWEGGLHLVARNLCSERARAEAGGAYVRERHSMACAAAEWGRLFERLLS